MATILSLETSTKTCSVALHQEGRLLALQEVHLEQSHSSLLNLMIHDMLAYCAVDRSALSAVAVSEGPGSYTGLRIGVSAAKGLCFALDIPLIAVNTLEAMAWQLHRFNRQQALLCPMIDARRMEVYCLLQNSRQALRMPTTAVVVDDEAFTSYAGEQVWYFGDGAAKCQPVLRQYEGFTYIPGIRPSAEGVGALAIERFQTQTFEDLAYFVPFYLKDFRTTKPKKNI